MSFGDDLERERDRVVRLVRHASVGWAEAMRAHKLAPPDEGFAGRLQKLSEAAAAEQLAWQQAHAAGMLVAPRAGRGERRAALRAAGRHRPAWTGGPLDSVRQRRDRDEPSDRRLQAHSRSPTRSAPCPRRQPSSPRRSQRRTRSRARPGARAGAARRLRLSAMPEPR